MLLDRAELSGTDVEQRRLVWQAESTQAHGLAAVRVSGGGLMSARIVGRCGGIAQWNRVADALKDCFWHEGFSDELEP
jgi:hypothetical protein